MGCGASHRQLLFAQLLRAPPLCYVYMYVYVCPSSGFRGLTGRDCGCGAAAADPLCLCTYYRVIGLSTLLAGGVPPCGVSPLVVFPPAVFGGCAPSGLPTTLSIMMSPRAEPTSGCSEPDSSWQSAAARPGTTLSVPAPGRPPGHRHGSGTWPAAAEQCSTQNDQGLPTPRAGSEYEGDLRARGADRYMPTDAERYASTKGELAPTEEKLCDMSGANFERPAPAQQPPSNPNT